MKVQTIESLILLLPRRKPAVSLVSAAGMMVPAEGGGTYAIEGMEIGKPRIAVSGAVIGHSPVGTKTGAGTVH